MNAGSVASTPIPSAGAVSIVTVYTTNGLGFTLSETLAPAAGFTSGSNTLSGNVIAPWGYSAGGGLYGGSGGWASPFGTAGAPFTVGCADGWSPS